MTDANYGASGIFAHKKIIKQFLQRMIEQVWRGVDVPGGCAAFLRQFFRATVFLCQFLSIHRCLFWVDFTNVCIFLLYIMCISSKTPTMIWAQNFRDVQLIPNFLTLSGPDFKHSLRPGGRYRPSLNSAPLYSN